MEAFGSGQGCRRRGLAVRGAGGPPAPPGGAARHWAISDAAAMEALGERLAPRLARGDWLALVGPLGSGKTPLVRGIARGLGVRGRVSSPTFTLLHVYRGRLPLFHLDLYRLTGAADLDHVADPEELAAEGVVVVEWADRAAAWLPADALWVRISGPGEGPQRRVVAEARGPRARQLLAGWT